LVAPRKRLKIPWLLRDQDDHGSAEALQQLLLILIPALILILID